MASFGFEKLEVWQEARSLCQDLFQVLYSSEKGFDPSLRNQMLRSSGSIMGNIAEGHGRGGNKEFVQFLYITRGSLNELHSQLTRATDWRLISEEDLQTYGDWLSSILRKLNGLISYLKRSNYKGNKCVVEEDEEDYETPGTFGDARGQASSPSG